MVKKHSWKFRQLDAAAVLAASPNLSAAARQLGVNRSSIQRWIRAGKLPAFTPRGRATRQAATPRPPDRHPPSAEGWAAAVRQAYALDATETTLVELAEGALNLARDVSVKPADRLAAMNRFAQLVRQLDLEVATDGQVEEAPSEPASGPVPSLDKAPREAAGGPRDPRWGIMPQSRLTPAMRFVLMTGEAAAGRIRGWVALGYPESSTAVRTTWDGTGEAS